MSEEIIKQFIRKELIKDKDFGDLGVSDDLIGSGIIDSLGIQKLLVFLEDKFSVKIADDELVPDNFETIEKICSLINNH